MHEQKFLQVQEKIKVEILMTDRNGGYSHLCTGFLITRKHVLSAAHCFKRREPNLYKVHRTEQVNEIPDGPYSSSYRQVPRRYRTDPYYDNRRTSPFEEHIESVNQINLEVYDVTRIAVPQRYRRGQYYDDIALLTLSREVDSPNFNPVLLPWKPSFRDITGQETTIAGYGPTTEGGPMSLNLQELSHVPVIKNDVCRRILQQRHSIYLRLFPRGLTSGFVCAGYLDEEGRGSCGSDSGDPLMIQKDGMWYAVGVNAFSFLCGDESPQVFTRITEYLDWIRRNLK